MQRRATRPWTQILIMLLSVASVGVLAFVDEERESSAALQDFAGEQAALAQGLVTGLLSNQALRPDASSGFARSPGQSIEDPLRIRDVLDAVGVPSQRVALLRSAGSRVFMNAAGQAFPRPDFEAALSHGQTTARLSPEDAVQLGLPARTAMAGLARLEAGPAGVWSVAVVTTAERERDREKRAQWRLVLAVALAAALVAGFGGWALKRQAKALQLASELAVAEVQRERDERLGRLSKAAVMMTFASGLAHELATPLAVIAGRAEQLLARLGSDEKAASSLATIGEQVSRMQQVVTGFLDLARGDSVTHETVQAVTVLESARTLVEHRFAKAGVALELVPPPVPQALRCSPRLLEHALVNLLLNACDACSRGGKVRLDILTDGQEVGFVVSDDGVGIPEEIVARVAEPFFTTKPQGQGTGLGLAIANEIAKAHRGSLSIAHVAPRGTRASLLIPLA